MNRELISDVKDTRDLAREFSLLGKTDLTRLMQRGREVEVITPRGNDNVALVLGSQDVPKMTDLFPGLGRPVKDLVVEPSLLGQVIALDCMMEENLDIVVLYKIKNVNNGKIRIEPVSKFWTSPKWTDWLDPRNSRADITPGQTFMLYDLAHRKEFFKAELWVYLYDAWTREHRIDAKGTDRAKARQQFVRPSVSVKSKSVQKTKATSRMQVGGGPSKKKKLDPDDLKLKKLMEQFRSLPRTHQEAFQAQVSEHLEPQAGPSGVELLESSDSEESHAADSDDDDVTDSDDDSSDSD